MVLTLGEENLPMGVRLQEREAKAWSSFLDCFSSQSFSSARNGRSWGSTALGERIKPFIPAPFADSTPLAEQGVPLVPGRLPICYWRIMVCVHEYKLESVSDVYFTGFYVCQLCGDRVLRSDPQKKVSRKYPLSYQPAEIKEESPGKSSASETAPA